MKHFPILRTRRLTVQLKELSIGDAIAIANMPEHMAEAELAAFIRCITAEVTAGPTDPADWTVQERTLVVSHYLASVVDDGPDFSLGAGKYSDYLDGAADISLAFTQVPIGEVGGDRWEIRHLTGAMAESIERLQGEIDRLESRLHWIVGAMAAQLTRSGEEIPELSADGGYDEWLLGRINILIGFPESDFEKLMGSYQAGREKLHHLFAFTFDDGGIVILPKQGGAEGLPPARFPVRTCLSKLACSMAGKPNGFGSQP